MKRILAFVFCFSLAVGVGLGEYACALNGTPPVLSPTASAGLTNGLSALAHVLQSRGAAPAILNAISDAQTAIASDVAGHTWGQIVRELLTELYSQIPLAMQNDPVVWGSLAAIEIVLATVGA